jgi:hypothetical protein
MFLCQWTLDIQFGKQGEALSIIKEWGAEKMKSSGFSVSTQGRVYVGYIGYSPAHIVDEYVFKSLDEFEKALADMAKPQFKQFAERMSKVIIPGTQKWQIFKIIE